MLRNIDQARTIYPGWQVIVYHDETVPVDILAAIIEQGAMTKLVSNDVYGMFWRFYAVNLEDCGYVIFRDSDSRLSAREKAAVNEWIATGKVLHVMRDHPYHRDPIDGIIYNILGGMWGIKGNVIPLTKMINTYALGKPHQYGSDQIFLNNIYEIFNHSLVIHDEFFDRKPFPLKRKGYRFVGERFNENDEPFEDDWRIIKNYYEVKTLKGKLLGSLKNIYHFFKRRFDAV